jgi:hypothetical protein
MSLGNPSAGPNNAASYMVVSDPFVTASSVGTTPERTQFTKVSSWITIHNTGSNNSLRVGFSENGLVSSSHYFVLGNNDSFTGNFRATEIWMQSLGGTATYELIAGLTIIPEANFWILTGSTTAQTGNVRHLGMPGIG